MRRIPMLRAIQAFEAAARKENYADAAAELNVTPAAIGQQVRALEAWLGSPLFRRLSSGANRLVLTDGARAAMPDLTEGLDRLDAGMRRLRQQGHRCLVTVSASQALVARWLLPRLERFTMARPDIDVRLDVSDRLADIERGEADIGIRFGAGHWDGLRAVELMDEEVFPVCSPALVANGQPQTAEQLLALTLIHDLTLVQPEVFPSWSSWLGRLNHHKALTGAGLKINASAAVIQAALSGQGVALARRSFVMEEVLAGRLLRLMPDVSWPIPWRYFIVLPALTEPPEPVAHFSRWLLDEASLDRPRFQ